MPLSALRLYKVVKGRIGAADMKPAPGGKYAGYVAALIVASVYKLIFLPLFYYCNVCFATNYGEIKVFRSRPSCADMT